MQSFDTFCLRPEIVSALGKLNFTTPTPIQAAAIPVALEGRDIMGTAQTGTGKTGAFGIPLVSHLLNNTQDAALVLTPTRELAVQVMDMLRKILGHSKVINTALLIGGESMPKQLSDLRRRNPRLIVGTPGRINDHLLRTSIKLNNTKFLVLDETDRMLDMGFSIQIDKIISHIAQDRQTLMFSATLPNNILKLAGKYLVNPERISTGSTFSPATQVKQETILLDNEADKYQQLLAELEQREGSVIVFVKTKFGADKLAKKLRNLNHTADAIHGDLKQGQRTRTINSFREGKNRILIATDIAARGLDIPHIKHVINFDLPQCPEDYIHRIGRTARAGADGWAVNLVTPLDKKKWTAIERLLNPNLKEKRERSPAKIKAFKRDNQRRIKSKKRPQHNGDGQFQMKRRRSA